MKFLLRKDRGQTSIRKIGGRLRALGSGRHWIEKYRGAIFVNVSDDRDEAILRTEYPDILATVAGNINNDPSPLSGSDRTAPGPENPDLLQN